MRKPTIATMLLLGTVTLLSGQDTPKEGQMQMPSAEEMQKMMEGMKEWRESMNPNAHHEALQQFVGNWNTTFKVYMMGPGSEPMESTGEATVAWALGKRFLKQTYSGKMTMPGMAGIETLDYEGEGLTGYDNIRNMYVATWASSMGTHIQTMKGSADPSGKVFRYYGEMDEPMLNVYGRTVKFVTRVINADKFVFEIFDLHANDDYKVIEIVYTRK
jgi:hypothetical protein